LTDYNSLDEILVFYEVRQTTLTKIHVTNTSYYTDSAGNHNLVELEYDDFGPRSVNLIKNLLEDRFEMRYEDRFVTTDVKRAIKLALIAFKKSNHNINSLPDFFKEYYVEYPELFL